MLKAATDYIVNEKGEEVISDRHQSDYKKEEEAQPQETATSENFTDISFEDI